jgi:hypothetical protein
MVAPLVFLGTIEPISLTPDSFVERTGVPIPYEWAVTPVSTLYVCLVENVLGRVHWRGESGRNGGGVTMGVGFAPRSESVDQIEFDLHGSRLRNSGGT